MKTKNILLYSIIGGLFVVPFISFIVPSTMYFPFIVGKGFAFRILVEVFFGLYAILVFIAPEYRPKMSWITKILGIFVLVILVADLLGANTYKSLWSNYERMEGFVLIAHLALYYIVASSVFKTVSRWHQFFNASILSSVIMSFYGILQLMGKLTINQGGVRVDGTFGNASYLAIYLVFNIFLCIYMFVQSGQAKWKKWMYGLAGILQVYILYFTATRGAILGFIGGLVLAGILVVFREKENIKLRKYAYGVLIAFVVLVGGFLLIRNTTFVKNSPVLSRFSTLSVAELQTQGRYFVWPMAVKGVIERPLLGWGQENFNFVFNKYYDPRMYGQEQWFDRTHNIVLDWMIAGGLLGFLAYAGMYVALFYYIWRKESMLTLSEKSIFTGMISAYIFHNMFVFDNLLSYIMFFSVLGFVHSISVLRKESKGAFYTKMFSSDVNNYAVGPIAAVLVIIGVYFINVPAINANFTLIQAMTPQQQGGVEKNLTLFKQSFAYNSFGSSEALEQLIQVTSQIAGTAQAPDSIKQEFYDFTNQKIEEKIKQTPNDARYLVFAGSFYNRFQKYDDAIKYLERALANSPKKQPIFFELGTSYLGKGDKQKMFDLFKQAYDLEPNSPESQIVYAVGAIYTKNTEVLKELSSKISPDTIVNDNRFLRAFADIGDYQTVITILTTRLQKDPTNAQYMLSLASAYATIGQKQKAIDLINEIIKNNPDFKTQGETYIKQIQNS
jgi:O-antigen ligase/tetratricopeptide (TPR) repeat protein